MEPEENGPLIQRVELLRAALYRRWQRHLDQTVPWVATRWGAVAVGLSLFLVRVILWVQGFYIVTYALGIYVLSLVIGFLSPLDDPDSDLSADLPVTTSKNDDEFKPFVRHSDRRSCPGLILLLGSKTTRVQVLVSVCACFSVGLCCDFHSRVGHSSILANLSCLLRCSCCRATTGSIRPYEAARLRPFLVCQAEVCA